MDNTSTKETEESSAEETFYFLYARAFAYDLLKCMFLKEPSRQFIKRLIEGEIVQAFPFYDSGTDLGKAIDTMRVYFKALDPSSEKWFQKLHGDFTRLFMGPGEIPAPPWESIYRDPERLHFSQETLRVREAFRKYNLLPRRFGKDPDDHIGLELDFMHKLSEMAKEQAKGPDKKILLDILQDQRAFLDDHLLKWVPFWSKDVEEKASTGFYKAAAQLLRAYLKLDREILEAFIEALTAGAEPAWSSRDDSC